MSRPRRTCLGPGCERPAKQLKAPVPGKPGRVFTAATTEPAFCTLRCAANLALIDCVDNIYNEGSQSWCEAHGWYASAPYEGACPDCEREPE